MTLQTAKNRIKKAIKVYAFAIQKQLPVRAHYPSNALAAAKQKLYLTDTIKLEKWYAKQNIAA